jgi:hypothetical protein
MSSIARHEDEEKTQAVKEHPLRIARPDVVATARTTADPATTTEAARRRSADLGDVAGDGATYASPSWPS